MRVRLKRDRLLDLIARSGLTQNHWAIKLGLSRGHWSNIVNGKHPYPSARTRERILEVAAVEFDELFEVETGPSGWSDQNFQSAIADRYLIDREIGQGGMGTVYLARDVKHARQVAIKVVSPEAVSGIGVEQFLKETRNSARLQHPHILPLYDSGEVAGHPFYAMPHIKDGSLRDLLERKQRLSVKETLRITRGVAAALHYAHENQLLHCDVKPENVLLFGEHAYVADFGISRALHAEAFQWGRRAEIDSSAGTPAYVSPEQATGEPQLDGRTDVYSLGCMVYEMLSGRQPFSGSTTMEIVSQRFTDDPPDLLKVAPYIRRSVAAVVQRAMATDPARRYASSVAFDEALEDAAEHHHPVREVAGALWVRASKLAGWVFDVATVSPQVRRKLGMLMQDIRYAVRSLRARPAFALVAILTLAVGIGANAAVFSVVEAVALRPLPFRDPDALMRLYLVMPTRVGQAGPGADMVWSYPKFESLRDIQDLFESVVAFQPDRATLTDVGDPVRLEGESVGAGYYDLLGVRAAIGRTFLPEEDATPGTHPVAILGNDLWRRRFGADPSVLGRSLTLDGTPYQVVGVMPPGFRGLTARAEFWLPTMTVNASHLRSAGGHSFSVIARVRPGVAPEQVKQAMPTLGQSIDEIYAGSAPWSARASTLEEVRVEPAIRRSVWLLFGAVGFVLLIACVNLANLLLGRAATRRREIALRLSLGATRGRVVQQLLTESLLLSFAGAVVGVGLAIPTVRVLGSIAPQGSWSFLDDVSGLTQITMSGIRIDLPVLLFALVTAVVTGILFGLAPALKISRPDLTQSLKDGGSPVVWNRWRVNISELLIVAEVTLAFVLLVGSGLMLKSFSRLVGTDLGFTPPNVLTMQVALPRVSYSLGRAQQFYETLEPRIASLPGVETVGFDQCTPLSDCDGTWMSFPDRGGDENTYIVGVHFVTSGYFDALRVPLRTGRSFSVGDRDNSPLVVIVNEAAARNYWEGDDPVGSTVAVWGEQREVVGVVANVHYDSGVQGTAQPALYFPYAQVPLRTGYLFVRTTRNPRSLLPGIREAIRTLDPNLPLMDVKTMEERIGDSTTTARFSALLLTAYASIALFLAAMGIYGVMTYAVAQRTREIGVRIAIGAEPGSILGLVIGRGVTVAIVGVAVGGLLALGLTRLLSALLFEVQPHDPLTFALMAVTITAAAVVACYLPARRATRVDPLIALRTE